MIGGLYAITPECADTEGLVRQVRQALSGGARLVQYRNKGNDVALRHEQASELLALCRHFHVPLIINDDIRLADLTGADGVHLGKDDGGVREARLILGPDKIIGVSCYGDLQRALDAEAHGAGYVAFGSFFPSPTKPGATAARFRSSSRRSFRRRRSTPTARACSPGTTCCSTRATRWAG